MAGLVNVRSSTKSTLLTSARTRCPKTYAITIATVQAGRNAVDVIGVVRKYADILNKVRGLIAKLSTIFADRGYNDYAYEKVKIAAA